MGDVNYQLVPAALLYLHPEGLTRDDLLDKLYEVKARDFVTKDDPMDIGDYHPFARVAPFSALNRFFGIPPADCSDGIYGLADILQLEQKDIPDEKLRFRSFRRGTVNTPLPPGYVVQEFLGNSYGEPVEERVYHEFEEGTLLSFLHLSRNEFEVISRDERTLGEDGFLTAKIREVIPQFKKSTFLSWQDLATEYPQLHPDKTHDWSQRRGEFHTARQFQRFQIKNGKPVPEDYFATPAWIQREGRFYLDKMLNYDERIWTSIVLTAEVVRNEAWGALGFNHGGPSYVINRFLREFPDAEKNHRRAILTRRFAQKAYDDNRDPEQRNWTAGELWQEIARCGFASDGMMEDITNCAEELEEGSSNKPFQPKPLKPITCPYPFPEELEEQFMRDINPFGESYEGEFKNLYRVYAKLQKSGLDI